MDLYTKTSYELSELLTRRYSTSFSQSSQLFDKHIRSPIFAIYGLVRVADEIVDTYNGDDKAELLNDFEAATYEAMKTGYSTNPIIHAFTHTARAFAIEKTLIAAFFKSMRADLTKTRYSKKAYDSYIYGSAEVIGLMCLKVFCEGDDKQYHRLEHGAKALGAAYQKVNFLRDLAADFHERGRWYFPGMSFESFDDEAKHAITRDIRHDLLEARSAVRRLPKTARVAVATSFAYYQALLQKIDRTPAAVLKQKRVRLPAAKKLQLMASVRLKARSI